MVVAGRTSGDVHADLTSHDSVQALCRDVTGIDAVVGIAAYGALDDFATLTVDQLRDNMRVNVVGPTVIGDSADAIVGMRAVPMDEIVGHYRQCAEGTSSGQVIRAHGWPGPALRVRLSGRRTRPDVPQHRLGATSALRRSPGTYLGLPRLVRIDVIMQRRQKNDQPEVPEDRTALQTCTSTTPRTSSHAKTARCPSGTIDLRASPRRYRTPLQSRSATTRAERWRCRDRSAESSGAKSPQCGLLGGKADGQRNRSCSTVRDQAHSCPWPE